MFFTWVCSVCGEYRDYGNDEIAAENPSVHLKCNWCKKVTLHKQQNENGDYVGEDVKEFVVAAPTVKKLRKDLFRTAKNFLKDGYQVNAEKMKQSDVTGEWYVTGRAKR